MKKKIYRPPGNFNFTSSDPKCPLEQIRKQGRFLNQTPYQTLDAPKMLDDFYLNLLSWSTSNLVAVGLDSQVFMHMTENRKTMRLCTLREESDAAACVSWNPNGMHLAVGTFTTGLHYYDANCGRLLRKFSEEKGRQGARVGSTAFKSEDIFASGWYDGSVQIHDLRVKEDYVSNLLSHTKEICGLSWSMDGKTLASGSDDNSVCLWRPYISPDPIFTLSHNDSAVKALAWSPHQSEILATGGGQNDPHIRLWDTRTFEEVSAVYTGSQVTNLAFSKSLNQIVSTHGHSDNDIKVWDMKDNLNRVGALKGHGERITYSSLSPCGKKLVTGSGKEQTIRFWEVFPSVATTFEESLTFKISSLR